MASNDNDFVMDSGDDDFVMDTSSDDDFGMESNGKDIHVMMNNLAREVQERKAKNEK